MIELEPCYALFSGGKDSFATAQYLREQGMLLGCVALETGIAVPDWKPGIEELCAKHRFPLRFYRTTDDFDRIVKKFGFPGPAQHGMFMNYLKGRAIRQYKRAKSWDPACKWRAQRRIDQACAVYKTVEPLRGRACLCADPRLDHRAGMGLRDCSWL